MFFNSFRQGIHLNAGLHGFLTLLIFLVSVLLLMKPSSNFRLIILAALGTLDFFLRLPSMPNHFMIMGVVNIAITFQAILPLIRRDLTKEWFSEMVAFLRLLFILVYGSAAFAKFNSGFFTPETSCAYTLAKRELEWLGLNTQFIPFEYLPLLIAGTEAVIFIGLVFRALRTFAVMLAVIFHVSLSLTPVSQGLGFNFVLFGLLCLFTSSEVAGELIRRVREKQLRISRRIPMDVLKYLACTLAMVIALLFLVTEKSRIIELGVRWLASLIVLSALGSLLIYLSLLSRNQAQIKGYFSIGNIRKGLIFVLVLVNALSPYMGLKTRPTFTMYSNLKVEGGSSNHFILPRLFVPNLADDLVTIIDSSDPELKNDSRLGTQWVYLELQRRVQNEPQISIIYRRGGNLYGYNLSSDSALTQEPQLTNPSEIQLKLSSFRKVYSTNHCSW